MGERLEGTTVGNYVIRDKIGEGGMGVVYLAEHPRIRRRVAVKVLRHSDNPPKDALPRFLNEARAASEIESDHVIKILDFGELSDGAPYLVMEWLQGDTLSAILRREPRLPIPRVLHILRGIGRALEAAHARGVIHRDLKPDNVFLVQRDEDADFVKVLDFGIAKFVERGPQDHFRTQTGALIGTPMYMSPEQCRGARELDQLSDVYSLGVIAYELLAGQPPFVRAGYGEILIAHVSEPPVSLASIDANIPAHIVDGVAAALAKDPHHRPPTVRRFIEALTNANVNVNVRPPSSPSRSAPTLILPDDSRPRASTTLDAAATEVPRTERTTPRRRPAALLGGALALLLVASAGIWMLVRPGDKSDETKETAVRQTLTHAPGEAPHEVPNEVPNEAPREAPAASRPRPAPSAALGEVHAAAPLPARAPAPPPAVAPPAAETAAKLAEPPAQPALKAAQPEHRPRREPTTTPSRSSIDGLASDGLARDGLARDFPEQPARHEGSHKTTGKDEEPPADSAPARPRLHLQTQFPGQ